MFAIILGFPLLLTTPVDSLEHINCDSATYDSFRVELEEMYISDQKFRGDDYIDEDLLGPDSVMRDPWELQVAIDNHNINRLEQMIARCGWPGISDVGWSAATGAFLILQHAGYEYQKRYVALFRSAVDSGEARTQDLALLEDRILMREGKPQLYGSQIIINQETGDMELYQVYDELHVDIRRAKMGLGPLAEYLELFGLIYTPPPPDSIR